MEDRCKQGGLGDLESVRDVAGVAGAARGNDRDVDRFRHRSGQRQVVAGASSVGVDGGEENFSGPARLGLTRPVDRRARDGPRAGVGTDITVRCIDRYDDGLRAEAVGELGQELPGGPGRRS